MENLIGKWGWVSVDKLKSENFKQFLHPETLKNVDNLELTDYVFKCIEILPDDYVKVKSSEAELLLQRPAFRLMPAQPAFLPLEKVKFYNSKGVLEFGVVKKIHWHINDNKHYYLIEVNGKMKTRRYHAEDLEHMA